MNVNINAYFCKLADIELFHSCNEDLKILFEIHTILVFIYISLTNKLAPFFSNMLYIFMKRFNDSR
jgi:hypothetical protein